MDNGIGKLPPQATEIEEIVLGAIMLERDAFLAISDRLTPEMFYKDNHEQIFRAAANLFNARNPIDISTVTAELRRMGKLDQIGGAYEVTNLTNRVASAANIEYHAMIIRQQYLARQVIRLTGEGCSKAYDPTEDVFKVIDGIQGQLYALMADQLGRTYTKASDILGDRIKALETDIPSGLTGISSGIEELDKLTGGWQKSDLIILAARPSMGKTAFMMHNAREAGIRQQLPVGIFSLEMSKEKLVDRMIAAESEISMSDIKKRSLQVEDFKKIHASVRGIELSNIFIDDTPGLTTTQIRAKALRMKQEHDIKILFIDYLGLINVPEENKNSNRTADVGKVSRSMKGLAKELDIPVIVLSQLSRNVENRPGGSKKPRLSDLRDSGEIEQDADLVLFLYRPEYYGISVDENNETTENMCTAILEKHRDGELGTPNMYFDPALMTFKDWNRGIGMVEGYSYTPFTGNKLGNTSSFVLKPSATFDEDPPF